jgi:hypothetical protein
MSTNSRNQHLLNLRPELSSAKILDGTLTIEAFQSEVLRPILKFQNDILIKIFLSKIITKNQKLETLSPLEKQNTIINQFKANTALKQLLLGCVIGLFTDKDFEFYKTNTSSINKRIFSMLKERLLDQWD